MIVDRDMGDEKRSVLSLSGGESFLVSLALALGLSSLSARDTQVRTLFIDDSEPVLHSARDFGIVHLLTLLQPDSSREPREQAEFPGILHFDEIMPSAPKQS